MRDAAPDASHPPAADVRAAWREGLRDVLAVSPGMAAWGLVTGVAMVKSGLPLWAALAMSFTVYAGSAQLAVLPLLATGAPLWVVLATAFCVNLRFMIYSAQWRPFFVSLSLPRRLLCGYISTDVGYALFMKRYPEPPRTPAEQRSMLAYFESGSITNWLAWQVPSVAGILAADAVPTQWGLGFAGVLALLALTYSQVRDRRTLIAALVAAGTAVAVYGLPFKLHIVVAILVAVAMGLWLDGDGDLPGRWREALAAWRGGQRSPPLQRGAAA